MKMLRISCTLAFILITLSTTELQAQRSPYNALEHKARRDALMEKCDADMIILFGEAMAYPGNPFRQENDFYYFTGIEDPGSVLFMIPRSRISVLLQPMPGQREIYVSGDNALSGGIDPAILGFDGIEQSTQLDEYIARVALNSDNPTIAIRISPQDVVNGGRNEIEMHHARAARLHYNSTLTMNTIRVNRLKEKYPMVKFIDIAPAIDEMRTIKSAAEQEILRKNGKISAEAVKAAMLRSRPGAYEYQVEAAAMHVIGEGGAIRAAYPPIVASGPNTCTLHYEKNDRMMKDGDLLLIDFGGCLDYLTMDISRTWPVNGKFSAEQAKVYRLLLAIEKACIEAYGPGAKQEDVLKHVKMRIAEMNPDISGLENYIGHSMMPPVVDGKLVIENIIGGFGHFVGMAVHDVGSFGSDGLKPGMVFAIEPGLYNPATGIGIRIEDTVLITEEGCEVLTSAVPKEIADIEKLMKSR